MKKRISGRIVTIVVLVMLLIALLLSGRHKSVPKVNQYFTVNGQISCAAGSAVTTQSINTGQSCTPFSLPTSGVGVYLNGALQSSVKCDIATGTTSGAGVATINISGMGYTSLLGIPQTQISNGTIGSIITTSYSASSVSILAQGTTTISLLGSNVTLFANAALPYTVMVCGV